MTNKYKKFIKSMNNLFINKTVKDEDLKNLIVIFIDLYGDNFKSEFKKYGKTNKDITINFYKAIGKKDSTAIKLFNKVYEFYLNNSKKEISESFESFIS